MKYNPQCPCMSCQSQRQSQQYQAPLEHIDPLETEEKVCICEDGKGKERRIVICPRHGTQLLHKPSHQKIKDLPPYSSDAMQIINITHKMGELIRAFNTLQEK